MSTAKKAGELTITSSLGLRSVRIEPVADGKWHVHSDGKVWALPDQVQAIQSACYHLGYMEGLDKAAEAGLANVPRMGFRSTAKVVIPPELLANPEVERLLDRADGEREKLP